MPDNKIRNKQRKTRIKDDLYSLLYIMEDLCVTSMGGFITRRDFYNAAYRPFADEMEAERERFREIRRANACLRALKRAKLIAEEKTAEGLLYALTKRGIEALTRERIIRENKKLNKFYCTVVFDIPESQRTIRDDFRNFLKCAGFFQIQKSVWATDKDVADALLDFITMAKIEKWVNVFIADPLLINLKNKKRV